jgi:predicted transcriptional regulator of viral defense system
MSHEWQDRVTLLSMKEVRTELPNTFTTRAARAHGVHPRDLYAWLDSGQVLQLSRGVYRRADAPMPSYPDFLAIAHRSPAAIICCVSAAIVHELTDELPVAVQIAVPGRSRAPRIDYPPTAAFRFDEARFEIGLSRLEAAPGEWVRIYDAARTVVDLMRLRHRFGEPLAHAALQRYLRRRGAKPAVLLEYADALDVYGPVRRAVDIASAE